MVIISISTSYPVRSVSKSIPRFRPKLNACARTIERSERATPDHSTLTAFQRDQEAVHGLVYVQGKGSLPLWASFV